MTFIARETRKASWPWLLLWLLLLLGLVGLFDLWVRAHNRQLAVQSQSAYRRFMQAAAQADAVDDPLQRCLRGPALPDTHWHADSTALYCQTLSRPTLSYEQLIGLLAQGKVDQIDQAFARYLDAQQHDPRQPGVYDQAFVSAGMDTDEPAVRALVAHWKRLAPHSAAAFTASGITYLDAAMGGLAPDWRNSWHKQSPYNQDELLANARHDLQQAIALQPADSMAYRELLLVEAMQGDDDALAQTGVDALKIGATNFGVRAQMIELARLAWGDNFGGVEQQLKQVRPLLVQNALLRIVLSKPAVAKATCDCLQGHRLLAATLTAADDNVSTFDLWALGEAIYTDHPRLAVMLFTESLRFRPRDAYALHWRAQALLRIDGAAAALDSIQRIARRYPQDAPIQLQLAWTEAETGHARDAEQTYLAVLQREPDNRRALAWLGDLYNRRLQQPAKALPLAQRLLADAPQDAEGQLVQVFGEIGIEAPQRYTHIHAFIDLHGDSEEFAPDVAQLRDYLSNHPEQSPPG